MPTRSANPAPSDPVSDSLATNEASTHRHQANESLLGVSYPRGARRMEANDRRGAQRCRLTGTCNERRAPPQRTTGWTTSGRIIARKQQRHWWRKGNSQEQCEGAPRRAKRRVGDDAVQEVGKILRVADSPQLPSEEWRQERPDEATILEYDTPSARRVLEEWSRSE